MRARIPIILILFTIFLYIVGGNALSFTVADITIRYGEFFSIFVGTLLVILFIKHRRGVWNDKSIAVIALWALLSLILIAINGAFVYRFSNREILVAVMYLFRFCYAICFAYLAVKYIRLQGMQIYTLQFINMCYIVVCCIGFLQLIFYPAANDWYQIFQAIGVHWHGDPHMNRLISTDFDPNYLSSCLLIGLAINAILLHFDKKQKKQLSIISKLKYGVIFCIYIVAILLTKSRSGILGVGVFAVCLFGYAIGVSGMRWKLVAVAAVVVGIGVYLVFFSNIDVFVRIRNIFTDPSAGARFESWEKGFEIILNTFFMGIGYNLYGAYNNRFYDIVQTNASAGLDSSLQLVCVTTGVLGLLLFVLHLAYVWRGVGKAAELKALIVAALAISNFNNLLFYSLWITPFYLVVYLCRELFVEKRQLFSVEERTVSMNMLLFHA